MENGFPRFPRFIARREDIDWDEYAAEYDPPKPIRPKKLKKQHSILYGMTDAKSFGSPAAAKPAPAAIAKVEAMEAAGEDEFEIERRLFLPPPSLDELTDEGIMDMKLDQLKHALRSLDLKINGTREKLRQRLRSYAEREKSRGGKGWDSARVMTWLQTESGRLGIKAETLVQIALQELDGPGFLSLTQAEIKEIGVTPLGQVKNVVRAVEELQKELS